MVFDNGCEADLHKLERLYALHDLLEGRRTPAALVEIAETLECSAATAKRAIRDLRSVLGAPLTCDAALRGYRYTTGDGSPRRELPGLWLGPDEIAALVTLREVLARLEPGLLNEMAPLARRLDDLLTRRRHGLTEAARRIRILSQHAREPGPSFGPVARAVLSRRVLTFRYTGRAEPKVTGRRVSPQRLTRWRRTREAS